MSLFQQSSFEVLIDNLPGLALALPPAKLQMYLQTIITLTVKKEDALKAVGTRTLQV